MATPSPGTLLDDLLFREDLEREKLRDLSIDPAQHVLAREHAANPHRGAPLSIQPANELDDFDFDR